MPCSPSAGNAARARRAACLSRRHKRLRSASEIDYVKQRGRRAAGKLCAIQAIRVAGSHRKTAIIVSRYYSRRAVDRNRARRLLREAWRAVAAQVRQDAWIILRPRHKIKRAKTHDVIAELRELLEQTDMITGYSA